MSVLYKYKTVNNTATAEIVEKKSRFIAAVSSVSTEDEAQSFIEKVRKTHYKATHNVYAYRAGLEREVLRYSDDGEPSGTAGIPILNILNGEDIRNTVIVVTRYFGGTLLGTGGLVRAYSAAAKEGLAAAEVIEKNLYSVIKIDSDYGLSGKIQYEILRLNHYIYDISYAASVIFTVLVEKDQKDDFFNAITEITNATAFIEEIKESFGTKTGEKIIIDGE